MGWQGEPMPTTGAQREKGYAEGVADERARILAIVDELYLPNSDIVAELRRRIIDGSDT